MAWIKCNISSGSSIPDPEPVIFEYTGDIQSYIVPKTGTYILEVWGAQGGTPNSSVTGGKGGYSIGYANLNQNDTIYICIGGQGAIRNAQMNDYGNAAGGYNGGGQGATSGSGYDWVTYGVGGGGGATHIGYTNALLKDTSTSNVLIVAGGGGGGYYDSGTSSYNRYGGSGGGTSGVGRNAGTQTTGYAFGQGENRSTGGVDTAKWAGGGGGWYGGGAGNNSYGQSGGGSGYISGVTNGTTTNDINSGNGYAAISYSS